MPDCLFVTKIDNGLLFYEKGNKYTAMTRIDIYLF